MYYSEYNIVDTPGSPSLASGWIKHSETTIKNMRNAANNRDKSS